MAKIKTIPENFIGKKIEMLTILYFTKGVRMVMTRCDCGTEKEMRLRSITHDTNKSCGCFRIKFNKEKGTHKQTNTALYRAWAACISRCKNPNCNNYHRYGGRGIKVCNEWQQSFISFFEWAKGKYSPGLTLDRINNDGDYCPENCRFVSRKENSRNTSTNHSLTFKGEKMPISAWADHLGVTRMKIKYAIKKAGDESAIEYLIKKIAKPKLL